MRMNDCVQQGVQDNKVMRYRKCKRESSNVKARTSTSRSAFDSIDRYRYLPNRYHKVSHERTLLMGRAGLAANRSALPCRDGQRDTASTLLVWLLRVSVVPTGGRQLQHRIFSWHDDPLGCSFRECRRRICVLTTMRKGWGREAMGGSKSAQNACRSTGRFVEDGRRRRME
jgi:hypothetical protein